MGDYHTCSHVFVRGPKKGGVCGAQIRNSLGEGLCSVHYSRTIERNRSACKEFSTNTRSRMYRVEIDNTGGRVFKNAGEGVVVRVVHENRARALEKMGGVLTCL